MRDKNQVIKPTSIVHVETAGSATIVDMVAGSVS